MDQVAPLQLHVTAEEAAVSSWTEYAVEDTNGALPTVRIVAGWFTTVVITRMPALAAFCQVHLEPSMYSTI